MKRVLVDINVALDVVFDRQPHVLQSGAVLSAMEEGKCLGFLAAHAFTTIFYLVAKQQGRGAAHRVINKLLALCRVASVDDGVLRQAALLASVDFEDAVTAAAAEAAKCDIIVTRDPAGFRQATMPVVDPAVALALLADEVHEPEAAYGSGAPYRRRGPKRGGGR